MKRYLFTILAALFATSLYAADCPVKHPALTGLDHASMAAAYESSFVGTQGRKPTWVRGSGKDDGEYWISVSNHYGEFGDGVCRAGWNAYWETKLETGQDSADPALGDQPAKYQPSTVPTPPVIVQPEPIFPAPLPSTDLSPILNTIQIVIAQQQTDTQKILARIDELERNQRAGVTAFLKTYGPMIAAALGIALK